MPLKRCTNEKGQKGWSWGNGGCQVAGSDMESKKQAIRVGLKVSGPKKFSQIMKHGKGEFASSNTRALAQSIYREEYPHGYDAFLEGVAKSVEKTGMFSNHVYKDEQNVNKLDEYGNPKTAKRVNVDPDKIGVYAKVKDDEEKDEANLGAVAPPNVNAVGKVVLLDEKINTTQGWPAGGENDGKIHERKDAVGFDQQRDKHEDKNVDDTALVATLAQVELFEEFYGNVSAGNDDEFNIQSKPSKNGPGLEEASADESDNDAPTESAITANIDWDLTAVAWDDPELKHIKPDISDKHGKVLDERPEMSGLDNDGRQEFGNTIVSPYNENSSPETSPDDSKFDEYDAVKREEMDGKDLPRKKLVSPKLEYTVKSDLMGGSDIPESTGEKRGKDDEEKDEAYLGDNPTMVQADPMSAQDEEMGFAEELDAITIAFYPHEVSQDDDYAGENKTFKIHDQADVQAAIRTLHHHPNPDKIKKRIVQLCNQKGLKYPPTWSAHEDKACYL